MKTTEQGGERGYDGGQKIHGRKRPVSVEAWGLLGAVVPSSAGIDEAAAAPHVLRQWGRESYPRLEVIGADHNYHPHALNAWVAPESRGPGRLDIVRRPAGAKGFGLWPKRGVVQRPFAWLGRCRRHSRDYERRTDSSESMLRVRALHLMLKRLKPSHVYPPFQYRAAV